MLSLDPFFSCVFRLNVDDVNVIFLSIFATCAKQIQTATWGAGLAAGVADWVVELVSSALGGTGDSEDSSDGAWSSQVFNFLAAGSTSSVTASEFRFSPVEWFLSWLLRSVLSSFDFCNKKNRLTQQFGGRSRNLFRLKNSLKKGKVNFGFILT